MESYCLMVTESLFQVRKNFGNRQWWWLHMLWMYLMLLNCTLKMVSFILYIYYHNIFKGLKQKKKMWTEHILSPSWQRQDPYFPVRKLCWCGFCCFLLPSKFSQGSLSSCILTLRAYSIQGYFQNTEYYQTFIILDVHWSSLLTAE